MAKGQPQKQRRGSLVVLKVRYTKKLNHAKNQVLYIAERSRELEKENREVFSSTEDRADYRAFMDRLDDKATRHPKAVKSHHLIISMKREDFDRYGADYKKIVRETMQGIEREKGIKLDWVAATHPNERNPHVHVIVKAVGKTPEGRNKRFRIDKDEFREIRGDIYRILREERAVRRSIERSILEQAREGRYHTLERQRDAPKAMRAGQSVANQMRRLIREEEFRQELEQRRKQREMERGGRIL